MVTHLKEKRPGEDSLSTIELGHLGKRESKRLVSFLYPDHHLEWHGFSTKLSKLASPKKSPKLLTGKEGNKVSADLKCKKKGRGSEAKASWKGRL